MKKTVVFILSTNYAGSHFLSLMLGSNSRAIHLGEIYRVAYPERRQALCALCGESACPVFGDISPEEADRAHELIFSRIDPAITALIDSSKVIRGWADRFLATDAYEKKYIHLIRDPRAFVRRGLLDPRRRKHVFDHRWKLMRAFPQRALRFPASSDQVVFTYQWLQQNLAITRLITQHRLEAQIVTYRDLARDRAREVGRLMEWIGLSYEPGQLEYWNFEHHGTQKPKYEWVKQSGAPDHFDLRWKSELPASMQDRILGEDDVQAYLRRLKLEVTDDGLTRSFGT